MHTRLATNNVGPGTGAKRARSWLGGDLTPGVGTADLQTGQSRGGVEALLGDPEETHSFEDQFFYVYRSRGVDVDFGKSGQRVERLFFYSADIEGHSRSAPVRLSGISFGSSRSLITRTLGEPDLAGGPIRVGRRKKSWICYRHGVQFELDSRGHVIIITIFDPRLPELR
jgi:hypothetical protein